HHAHPHAGAREALDGANAARWSRDEGLDRTRLGLVPKRDADHDREPSAARQILEDVDVALDEGALGDDARRVSVLGADFEAPAREPVAGLQRLVAIGDAAEDHLLPLPLRGVERLAEQLGGVLL